MTARLVPATLFVALTAAFASPSFAHGTSSQTPAQERVQNDTRRDVDQQQRIARGLQSGQLDTKEAGKLERGRAHVDRLEASADRDGNVSPREQARITRAHNRDRAAIDRQEHDAQTGRPNSLTSQRMRADAQRNADQQTRIGNGVNSGAPTTRAAGSLERGQARAERAESRAAADGRVGSGEQVRLQARENRLSGA